MIRLKGCLIIFICLFVIRSYSQIEIRYERSNQCDTALNFKDKINIENGNLQCIKDPGKDQILYFTKEKDFECYKSKNNISENDCIDNSKMKLNFVKYDVVLIRIGGQFSNTSINSIEKDNHFTLYLNLFTEYEKELNIKKDSLIEHQIFPVRHIYSHYILLPKGKKGLPQIHIFDSFYNCF